MLNWNKRQSSLLSITLHQQFFSSILSSSLLSALSNDSSTLLVTDGYTLSCSHLATVEAFCERCSSSFKLRKGTGEKISSPHIWRINLSFALRHSSPSYTALSLVASMQLICIESPYLFCCRVRSLSSWGSTSEVRCRFSLNCGFTFNYIFHVRHFHDVRTVLRDKREVHTCI